MGQGAWTALAQIGADSLGLDVDQVKLRFGGSDLPDGGIAGGSGHTATAGLAIHEAGAERRRAARRARDDGPQFAAVRRRQCRGRRARRPAAAAATTRAAARAMPKSSPAPGWRRSTGGARARAIRRRRHHAMQAHGAVFAEVKVDPDLGQIRVTRLVGAFAAGRIINPRLVRSQYFGGMIWGVSFALHESASVDRRTGRIMNANLGEYHVPVNADVPSLEALLVEEDDAYVNALGIKGVGEIGITGTAGAIANAVWHATGVRVRKFPVRIEPIMAPTAGA